MLFWMLVAIQLAGLVLAIAAIAMGWNYAFVVVGVVLFLVNGHLVRRELHRRGYWSNETGPAGASGPSADDDGDGARREQPSTDRDQ